MNDVEGRRKKEEGRSVQIPDFAEVVGDLNFHD
jgi:hypothetical protein